MTAHTEPAVVDQPDHATGGETAPAYLLDRRDPDYAATAYDHFNEMREEGRVTRVRFGDPSGDMNQQNQSPRERFFNNETWFVSRYDDVVNTLLNDDLVVDPRSLMTPEQRAAQPDVPEEFRPLTKSLLGIDPPDHTRIRKLVQPSFTGRTMEAMRSGIQATVDRLLDKAEAEAAARGETAPNRQLNLVPQFAYPFPVTVISDLLGIPVEDRDQISRWTENLLRIDRDKDTGISDQARQGLKDFATYLTGLFEKKRQNPGEDMISRMVMAQDADEVLTEEEVLATTFLMYLAGHVTTVNLVGNGVVALMQHPEQWAELKANPALAKNVVEETLRYWGPVDFVGRRFAEHDIEIAGTPVARGEQVAAGLASANHDPGKFADPEKYDIHRTDANRHVAFGKGIHVCLGAPLARIEGQIAFETLARRYPEMRLAIPEDELTWAPNFLRGFKAIPLLV